MSLVIRNVEIDGRRGLDVRIEAGRIAEIGRRLPRASDEIDGRGGALIPGLADHHIHLFGLAAQADSLSLDGVTSEREFADRLRQALKLRPPGAWLRVLGYHETMAGDLTRRDLDAIAPNHRLRVQHQTGALWILNSRALEALEGHDDPAGLERDTGRLWRGDAWLRAQLRSEPPPLAPIGRRLAAFGITALTDASVTTDAAAAELLAEAVRAGDLRHRLTLMSGGPLQAPPDDAFKVGSVKVLLDEHDLPDIDDFTQRIHQARRWGRSVAVHCVTAAELALTLAAFEAARAEPGDRIEHGGVIAADAIAPLRRLGLAVVTQPAFVRERGDRYLAQIPAAEHEDLYRCASLLAAGTPVAASSDAPYASPDPWLGIAAAMDRRTAGGEVLAAQEAVEPGVALSLYLGEPGDIGTSRRVEVGAMADLCLLKTPLRDALASPSAEAVAATLLGGRPTYIAG